MKATKANYTPPQVETNQIVLESTIAVQSPIRTVNKKDWLDDEPPVTPDTGDILLPI